jgi:hypothetical protein
MDLETFPLWATSRGKRPEGIGTGERAFCFLLAPAGSTALGGAVATLIHSSKFLSK